MELTYAPRAHGHKRRHVARIATLAACGALLLVALMWGARWVMCVRIVAVERQCADYRMHGETISAIDTSVQDGQVTSPAPPCWAKYYSMVSGGGFKTDGTAFLHERFTSSGQPRLVAVDVEFVPQSTGGGALSMHCRTYSRSKNFTLPQELSSTDWQGLVGWYRNITIYGGKTDAANPSHFTIDVSTDGQRRTLDGWISDATDNVTLQEHKGGPIE
jgi:hypothetical protein